ncbi:MAG: hypothetical protein KJO32_14390, partial [Deltaproteobacteria bacterium]|nr:hypothetical protein [Deltaproteobacteria bacterium]
DYLPGFMSVIMTKKNDHQSGSMGNFSTPSDLPTHLFATTSKIMQGINMFSNRAFQLKRNSFQVNEHPCVTTIKEVIFCNQEISLEGD